MIGVVDGIPELRGSGVVLIDFGRLQRLRRAEHDVATVVFERRRRPAAVPFLVATAPAPRASRPAPLAQRNANTSPATEWMNLGLNCGGAVLAWIGVVGMSSLAPVTGGVSGLGAALLYGGAAAATGQCVVSVARTANVQRGRPDINQAWDASPAYQYTMLAADGIGLIGAGGALKELKLTHAVLRDAGFSFTRARRGETVSRPMRRRLTTMLDLQGGRRASATVINQVLKRRLLDGAGGVLGLFASGYSGILNEAGGGAWDLLVWITEETGQRS